MNTETMKTEKPMERLDYFKMRVQTHVLYQRLAKKMTEAEFDMCVDFIEDHDNLEHLEFEYAVNRMFLDKEKTKNWQVVQELLMVANGCKLKIKNRSAI